LSGSQPARDPNCKRLDAAVQLEQKRCVIEDRLAAIGIQLNRTLQTFERWLVLPKPSSARRREGEALRRNPARS
jgi:hypothetical protein